MWLVMSRTLNKAAFHVSVWALPVDNHRDSWVTTPNGQPLCRRKQQMGPNADSTTRNPCESGPWATWAESRQNSEVDKVLPWGLFVLLHERNSHLFRQLGVVPGATPSQANPCPWRQCPMKAFPKAAGFFQPDNLLDAEALMAAERLISLFAR